MHFANVLIRILRRILEFIFPQSMLIDVQEADLKVYFRSLSLKLLKRVFLKN